MWILFRKWLIFLSSKVTKDPIWLSIKVGQMFDRSRWNLKHGLLTMGSTVGESFTSDCICLLIRLKWSESVPRVLHFCQTIFKKMEPPTKEQEIDDADLILVFSSRVRTSIFWFFVFQSSKKEIHSKKNRFFTEPPKNVLWDVQNLKNEFSDLRNL